MTKQALIIGAGPGGLASAILLAAAGVRVKVVERLPDHRRAHLQHRSGRLQVRSRPDVLPLPARAGGNLPRRRHQLCANEVEMVRLDPQYRIQFGAGGKLDCTPNIAGDGTRNRRTLARPTRQASADFLDENRTKLSADGAVSRKRLSRLAGPGANAPAQDAADAASASIGGHLSEALLHRRARAPGVLLPVEISRHVAVPLPEPVLDSSASSNTNTACFIPSAAAPRSPPRWPAWPNAWAWKSA